MTEKIIKITNGVSDAKDNLVNRFIFVYKRYRIVDRYMRMRDPKAKNMEILGLLSILIGITQFLMAIVAVVGNTFIGKILVAILVIEFISGFLFILSKCGSFIYSIIVNLPGLKIIKVLKEIFQARFPETYILITETLKNP